MVQQASRAGWKQSSAGQLATMLRTGHRGRYRGGDNLRRAIDTAKIRSGIPILSQLQRTGVEFYAADDKVDLAMKKAQQIALDTFFNSLGPLGQFLKSMIGQKSKATSLEDDVDAATRFLQSMGYEVLPPIGRRSSSKTRKRATRAARDFLNDVLGEEEPIKPKKPKQHPRPGTQRDAVEADDRLGVHTEQQLAGRSVNMKTVSSSNVYQVGFDDESQIMFVTYLNAAGYDGRRVGAGATYAYFLGEFRGGRSGGMSGNNGARIFNKIVSAGSVGGAIWSELRVKGSAFGHRYPYELIKLPPNKYVPRQATGWGLAPRQVRTVSGRTLKSKLRGTGIFSDRKMQGDTKTKTGRRRNITRGPSRALPNRGAPNRGY
jgi:hypothetical protein